MPGQERSDFMAQQYAADAVRALDARAREQALALVRRALACAEETPERADGAAHLPELLVCSRLLAVQYDIMRGRDDAARRRLLSILPQEEADRLVRGGDGVDLS